MKKSYSQPAKHWNCLKGNDGKLLRDTVERIFWAHRYSLNWPEKVTECYNAVYGRCPSYPGDYDSCQQMPDPSDPTCCVVPVCTPTPAPYITPYPGATQSPNLIPPRVPVIPPGIVTGGNTIGESVVTLLGYSIHDCFCFQMSQWVTVRVQHVWLFSFQVSL